MIERAYGSAGETVLVEQYLEGPELSVFAFVDGKRLSPLIAAVDYKPVGDGDSGTEHRKAWAHTALRWECPLEL